MKSGPAGNTWRVDLRLLIAGSLRVAGFTAALIRRCADIGQSVPGYIDLASETYSLVCLRGHFVTPQLCSPERKNGRRKNKTPRDRDLLGFRRHYWRRRRDSNPRSRFWPRCSLSRGVPSTSRPRLPNFLSRRESARRSQDNSGPNREGQCLRHIFCARFVIDDAICSHWPQ